ncbi:MAG: isoleucine--tRNA ligase [Candidatus Paceibacterota bacterium]|jgi:isoleucyl-tRNA synthetase
MVFEGGENDPSKREKEVIEFWKKNGIFEKSVEQRKNCPVFNFYDGPPFATGLPHYGHILASTIKDVVPRYWTMKGRYITRRWGWDCHGLPIENIVEEKLKISGKKQIEEIGINVFNQTCRENALTCAHDWGKMVERIGRFVDFENSYKTMDNSYIESVWWAIKEIWKKGMIYEGKKVLLYCPRCETPLSNFEVAMDNSYKDLTEESVVVKFKIKSDDAELSKASLLAWTTTPWTLPSNLALAINPEFVYVLVKEGEEYLILAKNRAKNYGLEENTIKEISGKDLVGLSYEPLYKARLSEEESAKVYKVLPADFVTAEDGTGIVHIAPAYGEDDYKLGAKFGLPVLSLLNNKGRFVEESPEFIRGKKFKESDEFVKKDLFQRNLLYKTEKTTHPYPFCWRCGTALYYNAIPAWFINIQKVKSRLIELNENINWHPDHLKYGRFQKGLESAPDWNISRNRYWASPLPIWRCKECGKLEVVGSIAELEKLSGKKVEDLHRPFVDEINFSCECGGLMERVPEVIDCWVESASMPFAELHYPFENKEVFAKRLPAQFVAEYIAQTRAWFYVMHVMSTILFDKVPFENVVTTGTMLNEKGEKLSKSKKNYPDPWGVIEKYGADSLRLYLMSSLVMKGEDLCFSEKDLKETYQKNILLFLNVYSFYKTYQQGPADFSLPQSQHILDKWILSKLNRFIKETTEKMDGYDVVLAARNIEGFINDLSTWYLRRSRSRFKEGDAEGIKTFGYVIFQTAKVLAPFAPFVSEYVYKTIGGDKESVHLCDWPVFDQNLIDDKLEADMEETRNIITEALRLRAEAGFKVKQPLAELKVKKASESVQTNVSFGELIKEEVNVKKVSFGGQFEKNMELDTELTPELKEEGLLREISRQIQQIRKEAGLTPKDEILVRFNGSVLLNQILEKNKKALAKDVAAKSLESGDEDASIKLQKKVKISGDELWLGVEVNKK